MKLSDLKPNGTTLVLKHPITLEPLHTDAGDVIALDVVGRDSAEFYAYQRESMRRIRETAVTKDGELPPGMFEELVIDNICSCIVGWDKTCDPFFADFDVTKGKGKYSKRLVKTILKDTELQWLRDQVDGFISERANFFAK